MVTNYRCFVRWKRRRLEMFRACCLVHPVVRWCYQRVLAGLQIQPRACPGVLGLVFGRGLHTKRPLGRLLSTR